MTNARGGVVMGMLGIDWAIMRTCMLVSARTQLSWTHNFFILDKGCPTLTWRWCFFHRRQTVSYPRESGSHLVFTSRCCNILSIGGFYHTDVNTSFLIWFVGSGEGLPGPLHWEVSRPTLDHHLSGDGSSQLSQRSPSVADQRVKVPFEKLNVECGNLQVQYPVGCRKRKLKGQMQNVGCEKMNVHSTELEGRIRKLDCCLLKSWMSKAKTWMLHKLKLNVECKKLNRECKLKWQTQNVGQIVQSTM